MSDLMCYAELKTLKPWQLNALCLAITERMYPNFALFTEVVEFGDRAKVRSLLDGLWDMLSPQGTRINLEAQLTKIEAQLPDLEEYPMYGAYAANDAIVALCGTLNVFMDGDIDDALGVANISRECVASFIEVTEADDQMSDEEVLKFISTHELMEQEYAFFEDLFETLQDTPNPNVSAIKALKQWASNDGFSNIGISLEQ
ncbi:MAG: YjaG family protein [Pontibacterium sp.]